MNREKIWSIILDPHLIADVKTDEILALFPTKEKVRQLIQGAWNEGDGLSHEDTFGAFLERAAKAICGWE